MLAIRGRQGWAWGFCAVIAAGLQCQSGQPPLGLDGGADAGRLDAGSDGGADAGNDGGLDAGDRTADAGSDAGNDAGNDAGSVGSDAGGDAGDAGDAGAAASFYGMGIGTDALNNEQVADIDVDYRFRAATSSAAVSLIWYNIFDNNCTPHAGSDGGLCPQSCAPSGDVYACGTGGTLHICIEGDDGTPGHLPNGVELGCVDHPNPTGPPYLPVEVFPSPPSLVAGQLYHVHWHNTDPDPTDNFTSVDALYVQDPTVPRQPTISDTDLAVFRGTTVQATDTPIFQLTYADSTVQGQGYMEVWIGAPESISAPAGVREQFTVSGGDRAASSVSVRLNRVSGSSDLTALLEDGAGNAIDQGTVLASAIPLGDVTTLSGTWVTAAFSATHTLSDGQSYQLLLTAPADTVYQTYGVERGNNYAFVPPTFFGDGFGAFSTDGATWQGFTQPGGSLDNDNADLQFYFSP